jgi:hypothetical protein
MMPQPRGRQNFQQKTIHRLPLVGKGLQVRLVETVAHWRNINVLSAMKDLPFHAKELI